MWARKGTSSTVCPKSMITGQSMAWLEQFFLWQRLPRAYSRELSAREVDAFLILEDELSAEMKNAREEPGT